MTDRPSMDLRLNQPHTARMYDYFLGGKDNYEADRLAAEEVKKKWPTVVLATRVNRAFMRRATRHLAEAGITQFLDIGTGIPTEPNLHQIAQQVSPESRVVYVDNDPIVLAHARALLVSSPEGQTRYIPADATDPRAILDSPELLDTLDLSQPVALSLIALLHFIPDDLDPYGIVTTLLNALAPGSYLVMSHVTPDFDPESIAALTRTYHDSGLPLRARTRAEFARFFDGLELLEPGIEPVHRWRPDGIAPPVGWDSQASVYGAVARK